MITPYGRRDSKLVHIRKVVLQRCKTACAVSIVMQDDLFRRLEAEVRSIAADTAVIRELRTMAAEAELVVRLVEAAIARRQVELTAVELEAGARNDIDHSVGSIAVLRG